MEYSTQMSAALLPQFTSLEVEQFWQDGFVIVRGLAAAADVEKMRQITEADLHNQVHPVEFEAELHYPGAPTTLNIEGGRTIRRLKQAFSRSYFFTDLVLRPEVLNRLKQLLGPQVVCPLAHHNCIMTKQPKFSSDTGWHQDIRYWSFQRPELINMWIALGREYPENGCLQVIPASHKLILDRSRLDEELFFRTDLAENQPLIDSRQHVELNAGDVLFFHCRTLHAASRNHSTESKYSAVFTFRAGDNLPIRGTRSAASPELLLTPGV